MKDIQVRLQGMLNLTTAGASSTRTIAGETIMIPRTKGTGRFGACVVLNEYSRPTKRFASGAMESSLFPINCPNESSKLPDGFVVWDSPIFGKVTSALKSESEAEFVVDHPILGLDFSIPKEWVKGNL